MSGVNTIQVQNGGLFDMKFAVKWNNGQSGFTEDYPLGESMSINLGSLNLSPGTQVWPIIDIVAGEQNLECTNQVPYDPNGATATYNVTGTSLSADCTLVSI